MRCHRQNLFDAVVNFDARGNVEGGRWNLGAQCFNHGVTARDYFGVIRLLAALNRAVALRVATTRLPLQLGQALGGLLALVGDVILAVFGLGRRTLAFERLSSVTAGAHGWALACLSNRARTCLIRHQYSNAHPAGCLPR